MNPETKATGTDEQAQKPEPKKEYDFVEPKFEYEEKVPSADELLKTQVAVSQENAALKSQLLEMKQTMQNLLGERLAGGQREEPEENEPEFDPNSEYTVNGKELIPMFQLAKTAKSGISELRNENRLLREKLESIERGMAEQRTSGMREKISDTVRRINETFGGVDLVEEYQVVREMKETGTLDHEAVAKRLAKRKADQLASQGWVRKVERKHEPMPTPYGRSNAGERLNERQFTKVGSVNDLDKLLDELGEMYEESLNRR